ncbi:AMIN-like domain-containing (lipo)protein [Asanoa siamensis]|uniref:AMIN-like domain-containing protein n=1 Tax=Asanoa siamensis TaxID=926357 RepID=A0ABQ4CMB5_9ACTN|nr:hypothetical protein [Asanoa siamensis]GIF72438.1 hypothetical protein Asi02nite_19560 [Asanoa siamensis]
MARQTHMKRSYVPLLALLAVLGAGGCERAATGGAPATATPSTSDVSDMPDPAEPTTAPPTEPKPKPPAQTPAGPYRVTYGWAVPSNPAKIRHHVELREPPAPALPYLVRVQVGDHPAADPAYTRITFAFDSAWPTYEIAYQRDLTKDGSGDPVPLPGNSVLRITFTDAQAHDGKGGQTERPGTSLGFPTLKGYGFAGDFEGQVTYGLGIQAKPNSDQAIPIRVGELVRADGTYVVAVDVRRA